LILVNITLPYHMDPRPKGLINTFSILPRIHTLK